MKIWLTHHAAQYIHIIHSLLGNLKSPVKLQKLEYLTNKFPSLLLIAT